jgi:hypothetical protein
MKISKLGGRVALANAVKQPVTSSELQNPTVTTAIDLNFKHVRASSRAASFAAIDQKA